MATLEDGRWCRWEWTVETDPPHRLVAQLWTDPLAVAATDRVVRGPDGEVLVRDYTDTAPGPERLLLLHGGGGHAGAWDTVVPHITSAASIHAIDLRGHGRSDTRHRYTTAGCVADIHTAEPAKSIHADINRQDVARLIRDLHTPAMFVLCRGNDTWEPDWIERRHRLADHATRHGHAVKWLDVADHNFAWSMPELTSNGG